MLEWLFSWEVASWVVGGAIAAAFGFLAMDDFKLAKLFFLIAAADAMGGVLMWGTKGNAPTWQLALATFILIGGVGAITVVAFKYVDGKRIAREAKTTPQALPSEGMVTMTNAQFQALMGAIAKPTQTDDSLNSDLQYVFYGKDRLYYAYKNPTRHAASKPSIFFGLLDLTNPYSYPRSPGSLPTPNAFPIQAKVLSDDYVRGGETQGNVEVLSDFMGHIKSGDVIWGVASVTCLNCIKRRAYYLYWKVGEGGWYAETDADHLELPKPVTTSFSDAQINEYADKMVPPEKRRQMKETSGS